MDVEAVVRGRQLAPLPSVLGAVDLCLPVLDAHAHGEGLALHRDAEAVQHLKAVAGRVADREDQAAAGDGLGLSAVGERRAGEGPVLDDQTIQSRLKADLAAEGEDFLPDAAHHVDEHVGADMGFGVIGDALRRTVGGKFAQDPEHAFIVRAGVELAVREGPGPALTELDVGLGVERSALSERLHGGGALFDGLSALDDEGPRPGLRQQQGREHARRAEADDNGPLGTVHFGNFIDRGHIGRGVLPGGFQSPLLPAPERQGGGAGVVNVVFLPRVEGALDRHAVQNVARRYAEFFRSLFGQKVQTLPDFKAQISQQDHVPSLPARRPLAQAHCKL